MYYPGYGIGWSQFPEIGDRPLALHKNHMKAIIRSNGHLRLEGDETVEELKIALIHLRTHTVEKCRKLTIGIPIESLLPDISVMAAAPIKSRSAKTKSAVLSESDRTD